MSDSYRSYTLRTPSYHVAAALPVSIYEPAVYSAVDSYAINGHGFGFDSETHIKAIGEYLERHVVFRAIQSTATGRICEMGLSEAEQSALVKAIQQTCEREDLKGEIVNHVFKLVDVRRLETGERCSYPAVLVSLHGFSGCLDADFLPVRDTSGNAIHPDPATAFRSALLEFVERQCTTAMWVSRRCNAIFPLGPSLVSHKKAAVICHQMASRGTLMGYDISFLDGASVIFGVYRSSVEGDQVNFACGCAADFTEQSATLKAFTEVWQTSLLLPQMAFFGVRDYGSNKLKEDFWAANKPEFRIGGWRSRSLYPRRR
jgi:ribosomal protein S12 methylthiotransferase accessory factor YcaO